MRDLFLDNRAVQIRCTCVECLHGGFDAHLDPVSLDVREVVHEQARYSDRAQDIFFARDVRDDLMEGVVFRVID